LTHAAIDEGSIIHAAVHVPLNQYIWKPAIIVMPPGGEFDGRQVLELPMRSQGHVRVHLAEPGLYWFGCPVANHGGRGMLGLVVVAGDVPSRQSSNVPRSLVPNDMRRGSRTPVLSLLAVAAAACQTAPREPYAAAPALHRCVLSNAVGSTRAAGGA
jgi:hypothetical protein